MIEHMPWLGVVLPLIHLLGVLAAVDAVMTARTAQGAVAWAISLVMVPYVVLPCYLVLGRKRFHGYVSARGPGSGDLQRIAETWLPAVRTFAAPPPDRLRCLKVLESLAGMPFTTANHTRLLRNGDEAFPAMFDAIETARDYVLVQFFIVRDDTLGRELKRRLKAKAAEGVRVYLLYDPIGSHRLSRTWFDGLIRAGVKPAAFITTRGRSNRFQINFRNHRKVVVADGRIAFVGGFNLGDEYMGRSKRFGPWRDTALALEGPAVHAVQLSFVEDYHHATGSLPDLDWQPRAAAQGDKAVLVLPTGPADRLETCGLMFLHCINAARRRLWISSPYFVPDPSALNALHLAALRGVDVRIMLPEKPDHLLVSLSAYSYLHEARHSAITFYRYQPGFLHQKVMLIDSDTAVVGTANMDNRSFRLNFELSVLTADRAFAAEVETMLLADFDQCRKVDADDYAQSGFAFKLAVAVARLMAPLQ